MECTHVPDLSEIAVYLGLDVGKGEHHAVALTPAGKTLHDKALPNSEPKLRALFAKLGKHGRVEAEVGHLLEAHPLSAVLTSMPGGGVRTGARILAEIGDATAFPSAAHLAAYAGLAPVTRRSGTSIEGETPSMRGNRPLKRALFLSAFASLAHPPSRAYYDRKISEGERHSQALLCLARRRCDVLYAMIRNGAFYDAGPAHSH